MTDQPIRSNYFFDRSAPIFLNMWTVTNFPAHNKEYFLKFTTNLSLKDQGLLMFLEYRIFTQAGVNRCTLGRVAAILDSEAGHTGQH